MPNSLKTDWPQVLNCREFWLQYIGLADDRSFQPKAKLDRSRFMQRSDAFRALLSGRSLELAFPVGYSLTIQFGHQETLVLKQHGKPKLHLLGWVDPHSYNHVFRFDELCAIAESAEGVVAPHEVFLLLLRYWGITNQDVPRVKKIVKLIAKNMRALKLFDRAEIESVCIRFESAHNRITECEWVVHPKWAHVAQSPMSLRSPDSIDIPDGVKFNFKLFTQFIKAVEDV